MKRTLGALLALACVLPAPGSAADALPPGVAWHAGDVDGAFAAAKKQNKPLFLYWGAVWCPPCNQVKATVFSRQDFIARSQLFVPVYIDGDAPGAQALGARFKVSGYPTMILFRPDGAEVTRLPGEVDGDSYMRTLALGATSGRSVKELLAAARAGKALAADDWRLLAFYSWATDEQAVLARGERAKTLWKLALASTNAAPEASARLALKAMSAASQAQVEQAQLDKAAALQRLRATLASPAVARANFAELAYAAGRLPAYLTEPNTPPREQLLREWDRMLLRQVSDGSLARLDRLAATDARVSLARVDLPNGPLPLALQTEVRAVTLRTVRESTDRYEREAVISAAAQLLADAGLREESDALLKAELKRSATPYYLMLGLADNARKQGDVAGALSWYEQAYAGAQGPATRLQWGVIYVRALIELAPADEARIERAARSVLGELEPKPETFHARNRAALDRLGGRLGDWNKDGSHAAALARLSEQLAGVCARLPAQAPERATCSGVLAPRAA
jgi:thiol-disulfide isomerase/thioredoxin